MNTEECILCWLKEWWSILVVKEPEHVFFCPDCKEKNKDDTYYDINDWNWRWIWIIWKWYVDDKWNPIE